MWQRPVATTTASVGTALSGVRTSHRAPEAGSDRSMRRTGV